MATKRKVGSKNTISSVNTKFIRYNLKGQNHIVYLTYCMLYGHRNKIQIQAPNFNI